MKSNYQEKQREKAIALIREKSPIFYGGIGGKLFMRSKRDFVLTDYNKNFYEKIRNEAIEYFSKNNISWWGGKNPTGHVLSSQIACLNHLYAIRNDKSTVLGLLKIFQQISLMFLKLKQTIFLVLTFNLRLLVTMII